MYVYLCSDTISIYTYGIFELVFVVKDDNKLGSLFLYLVLVIPAPNNAKLQVELGTFKGRSFAGVMDQESDFF